MKNIILLILIISPTYLFPQINSLKIEPNWESIEKKDWLIDDSPYKAEVYQGNKNEIIISNGLIRRTFKLSPNAATIAFDNITTGESIIRGIKPEALITINNTDYEIGGLKGQPNFAFIKNEWLDTLKNNSDAFQFLDYKTSEPIAPFDWKQVRHFDKNTNWPPAGVHFEMNYKMPQQNNLDIIISIHYELYDGLPVLAKWMTVKNNSNENITVNKFTSEILAAVEYGSSVEARSYNVQHPNIHVETDYAFASMTANDANHHVVHWEADPEYSSQVNYLRKTPCLLKVSPEIGPEQIIQPQKTLTTFRTFILPHDSYDRERQGLSQRRMYRKLAPWTTENPLMMHARFSDWGKVKNAIDQAAAVGFEMVILSFGSGFNMEDDSEEYLNKMKQYSDYAKSKGVEIGGYSLLASRKINAATDVVMREGEKATFGNSPCIGSEWGENYFKKLYHFFKTSGFTLLEHDGSYPGDYCTSENHPGHKNYLDSRWNQYQTISNFYKWCREKGVYLNIPDYYYMAGGNKCGMGYREVNWSLPRAQQVIHTRQNIYDGTWEKLVTMGWMFVPLTEYHGGGEAATIEPLNEHLDHYEKMMVSNLGAGVQACYRGPRLYDTEETKKMVIKNINWYKKHRAILEGDLIHLKRANARDIDYWLMVNPKTAEKGALIVFNPLNKNVKSKINVPLYYTGLTDMTTAFHNDEKIEIKLNRDYSIDIDVEIKADSWVAYFFK